MFITDILIIPNEGTIVREKLCLKIIDHAKSACL